MGTFCAAVLKSRDADVLIRIKRIAPLANNSSMKKKINEKRGIHCCFTQVAVDFIYKFT